MDLEVLFVTFVVSESRTGGLGKFSIIFLYFSVYFVLKAKYIFLWAIVTPDVS
jgi:hypothetical protein